MIEDLSGISGCFITSKTYNEESGLYTIKFLSEEDRQLCWEVSSIEPASEEEVWCVEEPATHTFLLEDGIVTGNCDLVNLDDMLQNGTVITGTLIEKPHSF